MEEPMSTTLTIPAEIVPDVREALFSLMGDATEQLDRALIRPGRELHRSGLRRAAASSRRSSRCWTSSDGLVTANLKESSSSSKSRGRR